MCSCEYFRQQKPAKDQEREKEPSRIWIHDFIRHHAFHLSPAQGCPGPDLRGDSLEHHPSSCRADVADTLTSKLTSEMCGQKKAVLGTDTILWQILLWYRSRAYRTNTDK